MSTETIPIANLSADERARQRDAELKRRRDERERRIDAQVERVVREVHDLGNLLRDHEAEKEEHDAS